jgi:acyl-CoA synthetase (NDP forming)
VLARDPDDMVRAAHFLVRHRRPRRGGVGVISSSGGGTGIASDRLTELGVPLAVLTPGTRAALGELLLPPQADNPIDLGGRKAPEDVEIAGDVSRLLFDDPGVAYGLVILTSMPFFSTRSRLMAEAAQKADKPVMIAFTPGAAADGPRQALREIGQFFFDRTEDAAPRPRAAGRSRRAPRDGSGGDAPAGRAAGAGRPRRAALRAAHRE